MKQVFYLGITLLTLLISSCKKEQEQHTQKPIGDALKTSPIEGLVVIETPYAMSQLTEDNDPDVEFNNVRLSVLAQAFQQIACDSNFAIAIGQAVDDDLECSVEHFLENNLSYKSTVNTWLSANGYGNYLSLLTGVANKPWIYAANYGVHSSNTPILVLSIELDSVVLGENDDFIPCYFSETDCNSYQTKLIGLVGDLGPEDPSLPTRALTIVFSAEEEESYNKKARKFIGDISSYTGTVVEPGLPGCEYADSYEISTVYVTKKFNKSKKVKIATRFAAHDNCAGWDDSEQKYGADKIITGKNLLNQVHNTDYDLVTCVWATSTCHVALKDVVGLVHEKDWYSGKWISGNYSSVNCPNSRYWERHIRSKEDIEVYAYFAFWGDWCLGEVREFNVPLAQDGDHSAYIRIKATTM